MVILLTGWFLGSVLYTFWKDAIPHIEDWIKYGN